MAAKKQASSKDAKNAKETPETEIPVPEFLIRADSKIGIDVMILLLAEINRFPVEEQAAIRGKVREFDLYEEATRYQAVTEE